MNEFKVEKITKYEALDKVNKEICKYAFLVVSNILTMAIYLGLTTISIGVFLANFPIAIIGGYALDTLDSAMKLKKELLNLRKNEMVDQSLINKIDAFESLTDEEIRSIRKR